jgi:hypothetical protein
MRSTMDMTITTSLQGNNKSAWQACAPDADHRWVAALERVPSPIGCVLPVSPCDWHALLRGMPAADIPANLFSIPASR